MEPPKTAMKQLALDKDFYAARQIASQILHLLDRFIPEACREDAYYCMAETFHKEGMELVSKQMRKEYEAWKQMQIDSLGLSSHFSKPE